MSVAETAELLEAETITLEQQHAFNLARWEQLIADPELARYPFRVESDRYGYPVMIPPPAPEHGDKQIEIGFLLRSLLPDGLTTGKCPVSTREGVKGADIAWSSRERRREQRGQVVLTVAPQICVEVFSPDNSLREMKEKRALYFEAGAEEVWFCRRDGRMEFFRKDAPDKATVSALCPAFPQRIEVDV